MNPVHIRKPEEQIKLFQELKIREDVAVLLGVDYKTLQYFLYPKNKEVFYKVFNLKKKSGGFRTIKAPVNSLKILQKKLSDVLYLTYTPKLSVYGFCKNKGILQNAERHVNKNYVLNIDLENFFPSIHLGRIIGLFLKPPYNFPREVAVALANICCDSKGLLPQGAPTSPIISNLICRKLDNELIRLAHSERCMYTRYADDITFSARVPFSNNLIATSSVLRCGNKLVDIITKNSFKINESKLRLQINHSQRQEVTGLVVNKFVNVHRKFVRELRAVLHGWENKGQGYAEFNFLEKSKIKQRNPSYKNFGFSKVILGKIQFIKHIKGQKHPVYRRLINKYNQITGNKTFYPLTALDETKSLIFVVRCNGNTGTGFVLRDYGIVTCFHVVKDYQFCKIEVFHADNPTMLYSVKMVARQATFDLALLTKIELGNGGMGLQKGDEKLNEGDTVTIAGFPRYRCGDGPAVYDAKIAGKRSGFIERYILDRSLIAGMSGCPVLDSQNRVIGVGSIGVEHFVHADTEAEYGIIPIKYINDLTVE